MNAVFGIVFPIYAVIAIGYGLVRYRWFSPRDMRVLGTYVLNVAMPALLFRATADRDFSEIFNPAYLLAYGVGSCAVFGIACFWFRPGTLTPSERAVAVTGSSCPNSGFIGYPVMLLLFPDIAGLILALNMLLENLLLIPACLILMEMAAGGRPGSVLRRVGGILFGVIKRPLVLGLLAGLGMSLSGFQVPPGLDRALQIFAASAAALSLVVIGGSLVDLPIGGNVLRAVQIAFGKLVVHPAMVALAATAVIAAGMDLPPDWYVAAILSAAMPMFGIYVVLAQEQGLEQMASVALLVTTTFGFVTLSVLLALLA